jgi:general secretion pathway protein C
MAQPGWETKDAAPRGRRLSGARLLARLPRPAAIPAIELLLLALIAFQAARLVWAGVIPLGPMGDWQAPAALRAAPAQGVAAGEFDPFFRLSGESGTAVVTQLDLTLFGVREDRATGRGSAIIGLPDGTQGSFAVGEEIMPGVTLAEVGFDSVTIDRAGQREQIFLDQSAPAETVGGAPAAEGAAAAPPPPTPAPLPVVSTGAGQPVQFQPRMNGDRVTGIVVQPGGDGAAFRASGFAPGDVIVTINNQRISSVEQARALIGAAGGGDVSLVVDRGGRAVPLRVRLQQ